MNAYALILWLFGAALWVAAVYDFVSTVLTVTGSGRITGRLQSGLWRCLLALHRRRPIHTQLSRAGAAFALGTLMVWTVFLWLSWTLIFCGKAHAVVDAETGEPASFGERAYYVGYTLTTLGLGDFKPEGTLWKIATVVAAANGLFVFTMAITYIVPVVSTTAQMRRLAAYIRRFGNSPHDIVDASWNAGSFASMEAHFVALTPLIDAFAQQFLAYPILFYFHSPESDTALPVRIAALDEALTVMMEGVEHTEPPSPAIGPLRNAISGFLDVLHSAHIDPAAAAPPVPELQHLAGCGLPLKSQAEFAVACTRLAQRRRKLLALVQGDGWDWQQVWG